jgi:hypothetical protein
VVRSLINRGREVPMDTPREQPQPDDREPAPFGHDRPQDREIPPRGDWQGYDVNILTELDS